MYDVQHRAIFRRLSIRPRKGAEQARPSRPQPAECGLLSAIGPDLRSTALLMPGASGATTGRSIHVIMHSTRQRCRDKRWWQPGTILLVGPVVPVAVVLERRVCG